VPETAFFRFPHDERKIDKVHLYLGPIVTGGPVIAFAGRGASLPRHGAYLDSVQYQRLGQDLFISGYPVHRSDAVAE